jgi:glycine hydroxymethyltransferase
MTLAPWMSPAAQARLTETAALATGPASDVAARLRAAAARNRAIHDADCFNLDPAANVMTPAAEAMLSAGLGSRPSLGWPGEKYETGLEAIEEVEGIATALAAQVFRARHAETRVGSGALANLYAFMALAQPGDAIIAPPGSIGGHVTHHAAGCAGLYGLHTHPAPVNADGYTVDLDALEVLARRVQPRVITIGGSLNLFPHPVAEIRAIADRTGAAVLFDAAHQCGLIAGGIWPDPLAQGAHVMTMSTYKSLGGPAGGLIVTNDTALATRLDRIAFPGMTANSDAGRAGALAMTLLDWRDHGAGYAATMVANARALAAALQGEGIPVFAADKGATESHQFALLAAPFGGGQAASKRLYRAGFITCGIGLPVAPVAGDANGIRLGTPEITRRGMVPADMPALAALIARALNADDPATVAPATRALRAAYQGFAFANP